MPFSLFIPEKSGINKITHGGLSSIAEDGVTGAFYRGGECSFRPAFIVISAFRKPRVFFAS